MSMLKVVMVWVLTDDDIHGVWKSQKKSHLTLWAMLKLPVKKVLPDRTKIGGKCQN